MTQQKDNSLTIRQGFFFPPGGLAFGVLCFLFAFGIVLTKEISSITVGVSVFLVLFGITFFSTKTITLDKRLDKIIETTNCFGFKFKSQKDLSRFKYVTILRQLYSVRSRTAYSPDVKSTFYKFDVLLLNNSHLYKQKITTFKKEADANILAKELSDYLSFEIVKFNPRRTNKRNNA
jgi:hypothetical protein